MYSDSTLEPKHVAFTYGLSKTFLHPELLYSFLKDEEVYRKMLFKN